LPYDRTILSKGVSSTDVSKLGLRTSEFLDNYDITYNLGYDVASIDKKNKFVNLKDGAQISYDKLLLATGVRARVP
jgi:NAD(P)H-nitrite reductase large subunit